MKGKRAKNKAREEKRKQQAQRDGSPLCLAVKRDGSECMQKAGAGTSHPGSGRCKHHAGATRAHRIKAAHEEVNGMATGLQVSPAQAIQAALSLTAGQVAYATAKLAEVPENEMFEEVINRETGVPQILPNVWLVVQQDCIAKLAKYGKTASDMGLAERDMNLREAQTQMVAQLLQGVLGELNLSAAQQKKVAPAIRQHLQLMPSEQPVVDGTAVAA